MFKQIGFATCLASLVWLFGVLGLFIGEAVFNISWSYTDALIKFPFGAIACIVILSVVFIKLYSLGKEPFYIWIAASFLTGALYFLGAAVLNIDLTKDNSISIAEIIVLCALSVFSYSLVLGFCKLAKAEEELRQAIVFWIMVINLFVNIIWLFLVGTGKVTSEVFHPMVIDLLPVIWLGCVLILFVFHVYLTNWYEEKEYKKYQENKNQNLTVG